MSSPASRKSKRSSAAGTPSRSARGSQVASSSPAPRSNPTTPKASRQSAPQSSPLFMSQSSSQSARGGPASRPEVSSPLRAGFSSEADGATTPRARGPPGQSSPIQYGSSSPQRVRDNAHPRSESSGLFMGSSGLNGRESGARPGRSDIHSDFHSGRRRMYVDENGMPVSENGTETTFDNLNPDTSEADAMGGHSTRIVWGTNISLGDTQAKFKEFIRGFTKKYRMWVDGATVEDTDTPGSGGNDLKYMDMLRNMLHLGTTGFNLDLRDLKAYPSTIKLWYQLQAYPHEIIPLFDSCIKDLMSEVAEEEMRKQRERRARAGRTRNGDSIPLDPSSEMGGPEPAPADLVEDVEGKVYRTKPFGLDKTINLRELNPNDMDKMVSVKGLVIRATPIIPDMKKAFFKCSVCNATKEVALDRGKIAEPSTCTREPCGTKNSMQIVHNRCEFADKQVIKLQETPDSVPDGQTPHSVSLVVYEELVDVCKAGDRIEVTGIFRSNPVRINPRQRTIRSLFKTYVDVLFVQKVDKRRMGIDTSTIEQEMSEEVSGSVEQVRKISEEEEEKIRDTAARTDVYELLSRSLAPSIYEHDDVKKGLLLQLFGGTNKSFDKGGSPKYRGDINVLLCGDPSTAKSQILQYVHKIAPRGVYTSGKGSSAVGLTAYVTRDPETRSLVLESGALVLSDGGICCIDEFDKMTDSTRSVLHEVMEQQTISIAKAGIITTLNARTSILASANPIGSKYNPNLPVPQNIDLPPTLLSRFDLVYLVLDRVDEQNDRRLARHLVGMYLEDKPENASELEVLPVEFLTSYISYARRVCQPKITQEASDTLVRSYVEMRKLGEDVRSSERRITATTRQLESLIRLSEAHAKMRLSDEVLASDVEEAVRLVKSALKQAATDARTGLIDMSLLTEGTSASERRRRQDLKKAMLDILDDMTQTGTTARYADVFRRISDQSSAPIENSEFNEAVRSLEQEGLVSINGEGARRTIRRIAGR